MTLIIETVCSRLVTGSKDILQGVQKYRMWKDLMGSFIIMLTPCLETALNDVSCIVTLYLAHIFLLISLKSNKIVTYTGSAITECKEHSWQIWGGGDIGPKKGICLFLGIS